MDDEEIAAALSALGQPIRLALYRLLVSVGSAGEGPTVLAAKVGIPRNLVSYHLQPLVVAGLVRSERRGRDVNYRVEPVRLTKVAVAILDLSQPAG